VVEKPGHHHVFHRRGTVSPVGSGKVAGLLIVLFKERL